MPEPTTVFEKCVFINCPFDDEYMPMLHVLIFTVIRCGFCPRIATEWSDSGEVRINKIVKSIGESKFSIHDISRMEALKTGDLPRFNMPFELGIDIGCRELGDASFKAKRCLVLEKEKFRYQKVLSDISGNDIKAHDNDPLHLVTAVRNWFAENDVVDLASATWIWYEYNDFLLRLEEHLKARGFAKGDYPTMKEYTYLVTLLSRPYVP